MELKMGIFYLILSQIELVEIIINNLKVLIKITNLAIQPYFYFLNI
jgi:hypothetical protein